MGKRSEVVRTSAKIYDIVEVITKRQIFLARVFLVRRRNLTKNEKNLALPFSYDLHNNCIFLARQSFLSDLSLCTFFMLCLSLPPLSVEQQSATVLVIARSVGRGHCP